MDDRVSFQLSVLKVSFFRVLDKNLYMFSYFLCYIMEIIASVD